MPASASEPEQHQQAIRADKVRLIHRNMPLMLAGNLLGCLPLAVILFNAGYGASVVVWVGAIYVLSLLRWLHYRRLRVDEPDLQRVFRQERAYMLFPWSLAAFGAAPG